VNTNQQLAITGNGATLPEPGCVKMSTNTHVWFSPNYYGSGVGVTNTVPSQGTFAEVDFDSQSMPADRGREDWRRGLAHGILGAKVF
jgi:hypothetical protein